MNGLSISPYAVTFLLSFVVSFAVVFVLLRKRGVPANYIGYSIFLNVILILYGAKLFTMITGGFKVTLWEAGISSLGGAIGLLLGIYIFGFMYKEGRTALWESYITVLPLLYAISKFGCYLVGCCHGIPYLGPWAVTYDGKYVQGGPYFPVQLVESMAFACIFLVVFLLYLREKREHLISIVMILCAVTKFSLEYLREEHLDKIISANQLVCATFFVWGVITMYRKKKKVHEV
ncbi:MAG: prolipoprotein diacylglyceryl transferase [Lachnospiraceae bacterium]|nr:prolipoprotein diacylglyceryl transferase [Lachnospiraceae bacterium]